MHRTIRSMVLYGSVLLSALCSTAHAEAPQPLRIAVFDVELDDYRDRASSPEQPGDLYNLLLATEALKRSLTINDVCATGANRR